MADLVSSLRLLLIILFLRVGVHAVHLISRQLPRDFSLELLRLLDRSGCLALLKLLSKFFHRLNAFLIFILLVSVGDFLEPIEHLLLFAEEFARRPLDSLCHFNRLALTFILSKIHSLI